MVYPSGRVSCAFKSFIFSFLGVGFSFVSYAQLDASVNAANYVYKEKNISDFTSGDMTMNGRDSISYNTTTGTYTKYKIINGYPVMVYEDISLDEMLSREGKKSEKQYMHAKAEALDKLFEYRVPSLYANKGLYNRVLQNSYADAPELAGHIISIKEEVGKTIKQVKTLRRKKLKDILPSLLVGLSGTFSFQGGYLRQEIANPSLPANLRVTGSPDFQVDMNFKGNLSLSQKLVLPVVALNNLSNFGEEFFKARLEYKGGSEEIIKNISLIQTNFNSGSSLIPSTQSLLGVNIRLQFGRLFMTGAIGQVRNQIQTAQIRNGKRKKKIMLRTSDYDENQHFFLSQYFHDNYEKSIKVLPLVQSSTRITRIEVWVTNKQNKTLQVQQGVAFMDMGEPDPYNNFIAGSSASSLSSNDANNLLTILTSDENYRNIGKVDNLLFANGMHSVLDYEKTFLRKLESSEYFLHEQLGYIMLNAPLQADDVLAVAYEYTHNGQVYQVGEFSIDNNPQNTSGKTDYLKSALFLKMLKSTAHNVLLPLWRLMMKNVYNIGDGVTNKKDVDFEIFYENPGGINRNYLPTEQVLPELEGRALLEITKMDVLNANGEPNPDGEFDFINNVTFIGSKGKIVFPHKRPFGQGLYGALISPSTSGLTYDILYDSIKVIAATYHNLDRFLISGTSSSSLSNSGNIRIGFNLKPGSVKVFSGATFLVENQDYIVDYNLGTLRIINPIYSNSPTPVNVQYENNTQFNFRNYLFMGLRWDYYFKNKKFILGGTIAHLNETPFYRKLEHRNDPINNTAYQIDLKYQDKMPWLSNILSVLPGISKEASSSISASAEVAMLVPGHSSQIGRGTQGGIFIDDFESSRSSISIKGSFLNWSLASIPQGSVDINGRLLFPEATLKNSLESGFNRSRLSWYVIDPLYQSIDHVENPLAGQYDELLKSEVRQIYQHELFPNRTVDIQQNRIQTFDVSFFPHERGPYNYDARPNSIEPTGRLRNPKTRWAGIARALNQIDFVSANVEYIEFWILDPFVNNPDSEGGDLYIQLGNISEDILPDGGKIYENGLPTPSEQRITTTSIWGKYPLDGRQITFAFNNNADDRALQDVGLDGLAGVEEANQFSDFISTMATNYGTASNAYISVLADPSSDNYRHYSNYRNEFGDVVGIIERYKLISNPEANSPVASSSTIVGSFSPPDTEDLNRDNVLNESESYYQYHIPLSPSMQDASNFVSDVRTIKVDVPNGAQRNEKWYQMRIPIRSYHHTYGNIQSFQSIRFIRMFMHNFADESVTLRFATMDFVINQWRIFTNEIDTLGNRNPQLNPMTTFDLQTVNIEENDTKIPVPYVMPPGVERQSSIGAASSNLLQNEQSLSLRFCDLQPDKARGAFKTVDLDLRNYEKMTMFIHLEGSMTLDNTTYALIRIGSDLVSNYYEVRIPLEATPSGARDATVVWPSGNNLDILLSRLADVKQSRDLASKPATSYYSERQQDGSLMGVLGHPTLADVNSIMLAVHNDRNSSGSACGEVWFDELRLSGLNEQPSWATTGRVNIRLADFARASFSGTYKSIGWGSLEQRLNDRQQESHQQIGVTANIDLHRMLPQKIGFQLPLYFSFSEEHKTPKYFPHASDLLLNEVLRKTTNRDSILQISEYNTTSYKISLPSVQFFNRTPKWFPFSPSLFTFNYTYSHYRNRTSRIKIFEKISHQGGVSYAYTIPIGKVEPFKNIKSKSKWTTFIKKFNFRYLPSNISLRLSFDRLYSQRINRNLAGFGMQGTPYYNKYLKFERNYGINWSLTNSIQLQYTATQKSFVEEDPGALDTQSKVDKLWSEAWHLGTNNYFKQHFSATYQIPFKLFPFTDWISGRLGYISNYAWNLARVSTLGNNVSNLQRITGSLLFNFTSLYYKIPAYRKLQQQSSNQTFAQKLGKGMLNVLTMVKRFQVNYTESSSTNIPGWAPNILTWGQTFSATNPGLHFAFGYVPSLDWFQNTVFRNNWIVHNPLLSNPVKQQFEQSIKINLDITPLRDLQIILSADVRYTKHFSFLAKDVDGSSSYQLLGKYTTGAYSSSYLSFTLLGGLFSGEAIDLAKMVNRVERNRLEVSRRLALLNPYANKTAVTNGYYEGYNQYAQDVLLPSFIAAFTNTSVNEAPFIVHSSASLRSNPFSGFSVLPNWRILYNGLTRIPAIGRIFSSIALSHSYFSRLDISNYTSALTFNDPLGAGWPSFIDDKTGNFVPYFLVPNITITEKYEPLFAIAAAIQSWKFSLDVKHVRQASLSLVDYQISQSITFGLNAKLGWVSPNVKLPFNLGRRSQGNSKGNFTFDLDGTYEQNRTQNARLEEDVLITTSGLDRININAQAGLIIDNMLNTQLYFEQLNTYPQLATSPPIFITRVGLKFTITLDYSRRIDAETILPNRIGDYQPLAPQAQPRSTQNAIGDATNQ